MNRKYTFEPSPRTSIEVLGQDCLFPVNRIYCVAQNYVDHAREMGSSGREKPMFFAKPGDAVCVERHLPFPSRTENLHHEVELVIALGKDGHNVSADEARAMVFGYAVGVDLTRRDLQAAAKERRGPWTLSKGFDRSAPLSEIRPAADCGEVDNAEIKLTVNGEIRQRGTTADMIWSIPEIIVELSAYFELKAGDLLFTGTPAGVAALVPGDEITARVAGVAELTFTLSA